MSADFPGARNRSSAIAGPEATSVVRTQIGSVATRDRSYQEQTIGEAISSKFRVRYHRDHVGRLMPSLR